jgi:hypothetical protein
MVSHVLFSALPVTATGDRLIERLLLPSDLYPDDHLVKSFIGPATIALLPLRFGAPPTTRTVVA